MYDEFMYYFNSISDFLLALLVLVIGWVIALIVSNIVKKALMKTNLDDKLFTRPDGASQSNVRSETIISKFVFWIIMVFAFVAFLNMINLSIIAQPFSNILGSLLSIIPDLIFAAILFAIAWIVARSLSFLIRKLGARLPLTSTLGKLGLDEDKNNAGKAIDVIANIVFYFVFLLFLPAILAQLNINGIAQPFQNMVTSILNFVPALFAAALVFVVGWFVAKVVRALLTNFLKSVGSEKLANKLGLNKLLEGTSLAQVIGTIVFVLIMIPITIASLEQLNVTGITDPAITMLNQVMAMIPNVAVAILLVIVGVWVGRMVKQLIDQLLTRIGFNNLRSNLGLGEWSKESQSYTLSQIVGIIAQVVIIILFVGEALQVVNLYFLVSIVGGIIAYLPHVLAAIIILSVALFFANLVHKIVLSVISGTGRVFIANVAKYSIIVLSVFMALNQLGVAESIVNAAFVLILGGLALAFALAFGLGGRDFAKKHLNKWDAKLEDTHVESKENNHSQDIQ